MKELQADMHTVNDSKLKYLLHIPEQAESKPHELWPSILFLHGWGESGDDLSAVMEQGLPAYIAGKSEFPFIVIAPQAEHDSWTETYNNPALYEWFLQHTK